MDKILTIVKNTNNYSRPSRYSMMTASLHSLLEHDNILLLQGKMGRYFCRFASFLMKFNKTVFKINFNFGDKFFYCHKLAFDYTDTPDNFQNYLTDFIQTHNIKAIVCFNDCRPYHMVAKTCAKHLAVDFFVFEEGYLRPDYITLQQGGINAYSTLNVQDICHLNFVKDTPKRTHNRFYKMCIASCLYYVLCTIGQTKFPHYEHYRKLTASQELMAWSKAGIQKLWHYRQDKRLQSYLSTQKNRYFVVTLQVHNDTQISHHSDYDDVYDFIDEVMQSFALYAKPYIQLVFKHHPLDRGHRNYRQFIRQLSSQYGITGRVFYGTDMHLPTLIKASIGMITINSTTALQAVYHKRPVKLMGRALYNIDKLANQQSLHTFWTNPIAPDHDFYLKFREFLIEQTQLNGAFYGDNPYQALALNQFSLKPPK